MEKIEFTFSDDSEAVEFFVVEQTTLNGFQYLLVTESDDEEADAYIMKCIQSEDEQEAVYEMVDDENELDAVGSVFAELLDDIDLQLEMSKTH